MPRPSTNKLRRLCDDIHALDAGVHGDILKHVDERYVTRNANGVFFDISEVPAAQLNKIREIVQYAKGMRGQLAEHDREMFESAQRLVSGPVDVGGDIDPFAARNSVDSASAVFASCEGEEAFCTRMEDGCVSRPAKGVLIKK